MKKMVEGAWKVFGRASKQMIKLKILYNGLDMRGRDGEGQLSRMILDFWLCNKRNGDISLYVIETGYYKEGQPYYILDIGE